MGSMVGLYLGADRVEAASDDVARAQRDRGGHVEVDHAERWG